MSRGKVASATPIVPADACPPFYRMDLPLSAASVRLLGKLSDYGIYGATVEEVAARFIDEGLAKYCEPPKLEPR
jgi:hypothetical protein